MQDSAIPYQAIIQSLSARDGFFSVLYSADSSVADSNRPDIVRNIRMDPLSFSDSAIQTRIQDVASSVVAQWSLIDSNQTIIEASGFNDSGYAGTQYDFTYKPRTRDPIPAYNRQTSTVAGYDSESSDEIRTKYNVVALNDVQKREYRERFSLLRNELWDILIPAGNLVKVNRKLGSGDDVSASWDASAGAAFDFTTDGIASYGVNTVERVSEGTYRITFDDAYEDANYTVTTGVGAENYSGTGSSPRQLSVISRAVDSLQVHCERTDDAVDEDNAYMAVQVSKVGTYDSAEVEFLTAQSFSFGGILLSRVKSILGYSADSAGDSDFLTFLGGDED